MLVVAQVQAVPSDVEEAKTQSALRAAKRMHPLSGYAITVVSAVQDAPRCLDAADSFQDTYLKPLRILNTVTRKTMNVWPLLSIETELI